MRRSILAMSVACAAPFACGGRTGLIVDEPTPDASRGDSGTDAIDANEIGVDAPIDARPETIVDETPRLLSPLSTTTVRSHAPTLRWKNPLGVTNAEVLVCASYDCSKIIADASVSDSESINIALDPGTYFWNVRWGDRVTPTWELFVPKVHGVGVDTAWGTMLDVDLDGFADLTLTGDRDTSLVVRAGGPTGPSSTPIVVFSPDSSQKPMGCAGDLDGDGFPELIMAGRTSVEPQQAYVFAGGRSGLSGSPTILVAPDVHLNTDWSTTFSLLIVPLGDVDADGYGDVALTMPGSAGEIGHAYLYLGSAHGISASPAGRFDGSGPKGNQVGNQAGAIDVDGDGKLELFVNDADAMVMIDPASMTVVRTFDSIVRLGDFDCDGFGDAMAWKSGAYEFFPGGASGLASTPRRTIVSPGIENILSVSDFDGDGCDDAFVIDFDANASVWRGDPTAFPIRVPLGFKAESGMDPQGSAIPVGDVNGDGRWDVVTTFLSTRADLHFGSAPGIASAAASTYDAISIATSAPSLP